MAVKRIGKLPLLYDEKAINLEIETFLHEVGVTGVNSAIENHKFKNRTNNLEDSYGYGVYYNGTIVGEPFLYTPVATERVEGKSGYEEAKRFLTGFKPSGNDWALVVVAGMFYADFVEEYYGLDVLQTSYLDAKKKGDSMFKNINFKQWT